jgi:serine phosphatase RsbU (regulator of sigma subunit)/anti-sigma regulatory factor (Ser/Thr protein kinase)
LRFVSIIIVFFLSLVSTASGADLDIFTITSSISNVSLGKYLEILEDESGELTIDEIISNEIQSKFLPSKQEDPGFGFTPSSYWVKLKVKNSINESISWYLEMGYPLIDYVDLYIPNNEGKFTLKQTGDRLPFDSRELDYRNFIFHLTEKADGNQTYYLRFKTSSSMNFPLSFWTQDALLERVNSEQLVLGIFYGAIVIMVLYSIFLYIGLRERTYLFYVLFIISYGLLQFALNGFAQQYLWPNWVWWANVSIPFFIFTSATLMIPFSRTVLESKRNSPLVDKILNIEFFIFFSAMVLSLFLPYSIMIKVATAAALLTIVSVSTIGTIIAFKKVDQAAVYFLTAFGLYFFGVIIYAVKTFGILPNNFLTNWSMQMGSFSFVVLLSVAVQNRINQEKKEKSLLKDEALEHQEKLVEGLKRSEHFLEEKVKVRTLELSQTNQMLKDQADELARVNHLVEKVRSSLNMQEVLLTVCEELVGIFEVRNAGICMLNSDKTKFKIVAFHGNDPLEKDPTGLEFSLQGNEAARIAIETKQPIVIEDAQSDPRTKPIHLYLRRTKIHGLLIVPILSLQKVTATILLPTRQAGQIFTKAEMDLAKTIATHIAGSIENARLYTQIEQALDVAEQDLEIGRQIQGGFLPRVMPKIPEWEVSYHFDVARQVGGDFYDVFRIGKSDKVGLVVADVCDKGVGAALFMVVFRSLIRAFSEDRQFNEDSEGFLLSIVTTVNKYISTIHDSSNMFATVFFGVLDPKVNTLYYVNAGHELPLIVNSKGKLIKSLEPTGPAIGLIPDLTFAIDKVVLERGDILVAYTDGVIDARNVLGEAFSEKALISHMEKPFPSAFSLLKHIESQIKEHISGAHQFDDITMLALRRKQSLTDEKHETSHLAILENLQPLREFIRRASINMSLNEDITFAFKIAVDEACTNIIQHGYKGLKPGSIKLIFERDSDRVTLTLYDKGISFNPENAVEADINADWKQRQIGGLGLHMVKEMIDEIQYDSSPERGNCLKLIKNINL